MDTEEVCCENQDEVESNRRRGKRAKNKSKRKFPVILLFVLLWSALVYGGYWYINGRLDLMQQEIRHSIAEAQNKNVSGIKELDNKLSAVEEEMGEISSVLEQTGKEVSTSGSSTREGLNKRMQELDKRLEDLRKSLEILKESKGEVR